MTCARRYNYVEEKMMIVYFLCCAFCHSTFLRVLIVSQEVFHAVGRVRSQETNENNNEISPHNHIHSSTSTATYSRRLATKYVPRVSSRSLASVDAGFVQISNVQLSQSGVQNTIPIGSKSDYKITHASTYLAEKRLLVGRKKTASVASLPRPFVLSAPRQPSLIGDRR